MNLTTLVVDLAKTSLAMVGMEACSGAHYWAREFTKLGHVGIIASKFIAPFRKVGKNDNNDV